MKRIIMVTLLLLILSACGKTGAGQEQGSSASPASKQGNISQSTPEQEAAEPIDCGTVVIEYEVATETEGWQKFLQLTETGKPAYIRIAESTTEAVPIEITYDGAKFTASSDHTADQLLPENERKIEVSEWNEIYKADHSDSPEESIYEWFLVNRQPEKPEDVETDGLWLFNEPA